MPLAIESSSAGGTTYSDIEVKTTKMEKLNTIAQDKFELPRGYKEQGFSDKLFFSNQTRDAINTILGGSGGD